ncbi:carbohydrate-binding protein [Mariniflexile ostreae]|uniref:Carbohydrate-binding protein n=1 Tax=Mariniflexile ostreae TaxID=1520892 RepID=A0ABV5FFG4_9FLAO
MNFFKLLFITIIFGVFGFGQAQNKKDPILLGTIRSFEENMTKQIETTTLKKGGKLTSKLSVTKNIELDIQFKEISKNGFNVVGSVSNILNSTFFIKMDHGNVSGNIILKESNEAYEYYSISDQVYIVEKDINTVLCVSLPITIPSSTDEQKAYAPVESNMATPHNLQSKSGAEACVYLDYDGHYLPAGSRWNNGNPINAAPSGFSDAQIQESWEVVAEDFRPYDINITTNKAVFDSYPPSRRMWCVFTPTNTASPGSGGVAYVNSFGFIENEVCWVFQGGAKFSGEAASHELGHTLGLGHDGRTNPIETYFDGHGDWAPIMGVGYRKPITQWSKGEYNNANNFQDDLSIMAKFIRYRNDDHGNAFSNSTYININSSGTITQQYGVIESKGDQDMFAFDCGTGNLFLDINTVSRNGNLDINVNLYEGSSGSLIGVFNGTGLNTHLAAYLDAGRYYISVEGIGVGNPATNGYSDYGSLGSFWISGTIPPSSGSSNVATIYKDCGYGGYSIGLEEGSYSLSKLIELGSGNDDISSLKVQSGYQATLYFDDNFKGSSIVKTGDISCLVADGFNDQVTSIIISKISQHGSEQIIEAEHYTAMSGVTAETCSEGGQNVGYIDTGDWMAYANINFPYSGSYRIEYRVASAVGAGALSADLNAGTLVLGQVNIPNTGGWQNWTTISHTVNVIAGNYSFGIYASTGGWNVNWIKITHLSSLKPNNTLLVNNTESSKTEPKPRKTKVYPNPFENSIHFNFEEKNAKITIYNILGQIMLPSKSIESGKAVDLSILSKGSYLIHIEKNGVMETIHVVKD